MLLVNILDTADSLFAILVCLKYVPIKPITYLFLITCQKLLGLGTYKQKTWSLSSASPLLQKI